MRNLAIIILILIVCIPGFSRINAQIKPNSEEIKISNLDFNQLTKKAGKAYKLVGNTTYGDTITVYSMNNVNIQWPTKAGSNDLRILQDSISHTAFGIATTNIDSVICQFVSQPTGYQDYQIQPLDYIPLESINNRILTNYVNAHIINMNDKLLTYKFEFNAFAGGAHPSYAASFINYDIKNNELLSFNNIFKAGSDTALMSKIKNKLFERYSVNNLKDLANKSGIFTSDLFVTHNVYLTEAGITFYYNPYDIGPWCIGIVEITIPEYELADLVLPAIKEIYKFPY